MAISTTISKKFFDMKMEDLKESGCFIEYKEVKPFWKKRFDNLLKRYDLRCYGYNGCKPEIVFLVGNKPHRFRNIDLKCIKASDVPKRYANAIKTEFAYALQCIKLIPPTIEEVAQYNGIKVWNPEEK